VLPIAVIIAAAVCGGAAVALAGVGAYFYVSANPVAAALVQAGSAASQFSITNIKVDLTIKTHRA
jgi:hypothetical protein